VASTRGTAAKYVHTRIDERRPDLIAVDAAPLQAEGRNAPG
jgi:hypothetical protein